MWDMHNLAFPFKPLIFCAVVLGSPGERVSVGAVSVASRAQRGKEARRAAGGCAVTEV